MSQRTILVVILALISGISAVAGVRRLVNTPTAMAPPIETVPVVVAIQELPTGQVVVGDSLKVSAFPKNLAPVGAIADVKTAAGRVATVPIAKDEPVLETKLAARGVGPGLDALVPVGMRAVTIPIVNVAAGHSGLIVPRNRVDILFSPTTQGGEDDPTGGGSTSTLLQKVEILAVDQKIYVTGENKVESREVRAVTLLVTPDQAAMLELAQNKGTLHLALRNPKDELTVDTRIAILADLLGRQEKPVEKPVEVAKPEAPPAPPTPAVAVEPPLRIRTLRGRSGGVITYRPH